MDKNNVIDMITDEMVEELNKQLNSELYSYYLYLAMAAYFDSINLKGFANWMKVQAKEEETHALKFYEHIVERGGRVKLYQINQPPSEWKTPLDVFEAAYSHETEVTRRIYSILELAQQKRDHATVNMLQWFISEQVEEEASVSSIVQKLRLIGEHIGGLLIMDKELGERKPS
ncbi:MAG: ferritin [Nitrososphaerales archaeon]